MISELQGPGFFMFFQVETEEISAPSGGYPAYNYPAYKYHPYLYIPKKRKRKTKEEKKVIELIEEVFDYVEPEVTKEDLELVFRLKLQYQEIRFKQLYIQWLEQEFLLYLEWKREQDAIILLLLH